MNKKNRKYRFTGTYICGHEDTEFTYTREYAERIFESCKCPKCRKIDWLNEQEKINGDNIIKSKELNYIPLIGSDKQVAWANTIRIKFLNAIEKSISELQQSEDPIHKDPYYYYFKKFITEHKEKYPLNFSDYVNVDSYFNLLEDVKNKVLSQEKAKRFIDFKEYDSEIGLLISLFESEYSDKIGRAIMDLSKFINK